MEPQQAELYHYKWIILVVASLNNVLTWGFNLSVGILFSEWVGYFNVPLAKIAIVGSLPTAMSCLCGPLQGMICHRLGVRRSTALGGLIMAIGVACSAASRDVATLCLTYGVIGGFGVGLASFGGCASLNLYFHSGRTLAESVFFAGSAAGMFIISSVQSRLIQLYSWQGAVLISGAVALNNVVLAMLLITPDQMVKFACLKRWKTTSLKVRGNTIKRDASHVCSLEKDGEATKHKTFVQLSKLLWRNGTFLVIAIADFLNWVSIYVTYVHLVERVRLAGIDAELSKWIYSTIGLSGIIGRFSVGLLSVRFRIHPLKAYVVTQITCGFATLLSPLWESVAGFFTYATLFGLLSGGYCLEKSAGARMLGSKLYVTALSWWLLFTGAGILTGPPFAGWLFDVTHNYKLSFYVSGAVMGASGIVALFKVPWRSNGQIAGRATNVEFGDDVT